jgi:hypothetical protein
MSLIVYIVLTVVIGAAVFLWFRFVENSKKREEK